MPCWHSPTPQQQQPMTMPPLLPPALDRMTRSLAQREERRERAPTTKTEVPSDALWRLLPQHAVRALAAPTAVVKTLLEAAG